MTRIIIKELIWDNWNKDHIKNHNVSLEEVEHVAKSFLAHKRANHGRYMIVGRTGSRIVVVIINRIKPSVYYVVTARDAAKKERRKLYEKEDK